MPALLFVILVCVCLILLGAVAATQAPPAKQAGWIVIGFAVLALLLQLLWDHAR
jgi:hypothetical protein